MPFLCQSGGRTTTSTTSRDTISPAVVGIAHTVRDRYTNKTQQGQRIHQNYTARDTLFPRIPVGRPPLRRASFPLAFLRLA